MRGISRSAASSMAAWTSSSGRFTLTSPAWTMRASGALAAEHILTALATSPARMHFCMVARKTSLLIDDDADRDDRPEQDGPHAPAALSEMFVRSVHLRGPPKRDGKSWAAERAQ